MYRIEYMYTEKQNVCGRFLNKTVYYYYTEDKSKTYVFITFYVLQVV